MEKRSPAKKFIGSKSFTLIALLVVIILFYAIVTKGNYLKLLNIRNILNAMVVTSFLAIGEGYLIIFGEIDLSTGAVGTMCAVLLGISLTTWGLPWYLAVIFALICGAACGFINAFLINVLNFQAFIATLAMASVIEGLEYVFSNALAIPVENPVIAYVGTQKLFGGVVPITVIITLLLLLVYGLILSKSKFGRTVYLCGGNRKAAKLTGINPTRISYILFSNCGMLAALSGILLSARLKSATINGIKSDSFTGITSAILGGISFGGGAGGMFGCFLGLLVLSCFNNGMTVIGSSYYTQTIASGALLIVALFLDFVSERRRAKKIR